MTDSGAARHPVEEKSQRSARNYEFLIRVLSALVMAPLAIAVAYIGGWPFALFWALAAGGILWEWTNLSVPQIGLDRQRVRVIGGAAIAGAAAALLTGWPTASSIVIAAGAALAAALAPPGLRAWCAVGIAYSGAALVLPVLLRADDRYGFIAVMYLFAVVWATDICAYFAGRLIGGAKLMPHVSPKKTWSGAIGGSIAAVIVGVGVTVISGLGEPATIALVSLALSVAAQAGDLFESGVKRSFGVKDAGKIIPGHGGLMDRLDGFLAAALVAVILGFVREGADGPARGLLIW